MTDWPRQWRQRRLHRSCKQCFARVGRLIECTGERSLHPTALAQLISRLRRTIVQEFERRRCLRSRALNLMLHHSHLSSWSSQRGLMTDNIKSASGVVISRQLFAFAKYPGYSRLVVPAKAKISRCRPLKPWTADISLHAAKCCLGRGGMCPNGHTDVAKVLVKMEDNKARWGGGRFLCGARLDLTPERAARRCPGPQKAGLGFRV